MISHLSELLSFDAPPPPPPAESDDKNDVAYDSDASAGVAANDSKVFLAPMDEEIEEPMEEIALEVTRSGGVIEPVAPGALRDEEDPLVEIEEKKGKGKWGLLSSWSKSKSQDGEAVAAVPVQSTEEEKVPVPAGRSRDVESETSSDDIDSGYGKVVGIAAVSTEEETPPVSTYRYKKETNKKAWLICIAVLLLIAAIAVPTAIIIPQKNAERSAETAAAGTDSSGGGGSETDEAGSETDNSGSDTDSPGTDEQVPATQPPTAAPTVAATLPQTCEPIYDTLGKMEIWLLFLFLVVLVMKLSGSMVQLCCLHASAPSRHLSPIAHYSFLLHFVLLMYFHLSALIFDLDNCFLTEITADEADACINCVWSVLPDNAGPCDSLTEEVCNILDQCECLSCTDELEAYLDCQSDCEISCSA